MTPVIFLHGIGGSARMFAPQVASFASVGYQPLALDLPGYGDRTPVEAMSFEALAEDVEFTIAQSALERPVLVGHSMGGMVVQTLLRRRPDDYAAAVLSCTSPAFGNPAGDFQKKFVADRLAPYNLTWYEEPVPPEKVDDTLAIKRRITQPMAGGEVLFGLSGFGPLIRRRAVDTIMPDVKHCGGLLELTRIAALAADERVMVAPHNPSGPVSTAASVQVCAGLKNVNYLELQYGEVDWRSEVLVPAERFVDGTIEIPDRPGFGVALNQDVIRTRALAV